MLNYLKNFISYFIHSAKRLVKTEEAVPKDGITELPDDVIGIIISHLKTEEAVRTSVLSSRWKYLWKLTTSFNFDCRKKWWRGRTNYISWVEQVVDNHKNSHLDELVVVSGLDEGHSSYLDKWISFAVSKRAKSINIKLFPYLDEGNNRNKNYAFMERAPALSGIECLNSLCLKNVDVSGELIEQFLSVCPLLERLSLARSGNLSNLKVIGPSLKLKYLKIKYCFDLKSIQICAPNLVSFRCKDNCWFEERSLQVDNVSSLVDLYVANSNIELPQFSSCFSRLETLTLWSCPLNKRLLNLLGHSQFTSLKHLTIIENAFVRADYIRCLPEFISLCPVLHKLTLELNSTEPRKIKWGDRCLDSLKVVELIRFFGHDYENEIAMFFLNNAIRLNNFIIQLRWAEDKASLQRAELLKSKAPQGVKLLIKPHYYVSKW